MASGTASSVGALLALLVLAGAACNERRAPGGSSASTGTTTDAETTWQRYWLVNTSLSDRPDGESKVKVLGPKLVEVSPEGRVRSPPKDRQPISGHLPRRVLEHAAEDQGLFLYVQREARVHWNAPDGQSLARLHPGAFVSVVPGTSRFAKIAGYRWALDGAVRLYVERSALGVAARKLEPPKPKSEVQAKLGYPFTLFSPSPGASDAEQVDTLRCADVWYDAKEQRATQPLDGLSLDGHTTGNPESWQLRVLGYQSTSCVAHAVTEVGSRLELVSPRGTGSRRERVEHIPESYQRLAELTAESFDGLFQPGKSLYWMAPGEQGPTCETWDVSPLRPAVTREGERFDLRLTRRTLFGPPWEHLWHPLRFTPASAKGPAELALGRLRWGGHLLCDCMYSYRLLQRKGDEIHAMARPLPKKAVAYDPSDAERWFVSKAACAKAAEHAGAILSADGTQATRLGFHAAD